MKYNKTKASKSNSIYTITNRINGTTEKWNDMLRKMWERKKNESQMRELSHHDYGSVMKSNAKDGECNQFE